MCGEMSQSASLAPRETSTTPDGDTEHPLTQISSLNAGSIEYVGSQPSVDTLGVAPSVIQTQNAGYFNTMIDVPSVPPRGQPVRTAPAEDCQRNADQINPDLISFLPGPGDSLLGSTVDVGEFDYLWDDDFFPVGQPLPAEFANTDFPLVNLSDMYTSQPSFPFNEYVIAPSLLSQPTTTSGPVNNISREDAPAQFDGQHNHPLDDRLPSLEPSAPPTRSATTCPKSIYHKAPQTHQASWNFPWRISPVVYRQLEEELKHARNVTSQNFALPTRHALSRYLEGYFRGFHAHLPFLHISTLAVEKLGLGLVLSLAAMGALYRFEHAKGFDLFRFAKTYICWQLTHLNRRAVSRLTTTSPGYAGRSHSPDQNLHGHDNHDLRNDALAIGVEFRLLQGLMVLMATASWGDRTLMCDAISLSSQVGMLVRHSGIANVEDHHRNPECWLDWIQHEERRRTLLVAFVLFNLQCIAFDVPPQILNAEVKINLPSSEAEWAAPNEQEWRRIRTTDCSSSYRFQQVLGDALAGQPINVEGPVSAFGNYVLVQAIFQQVFHARNASGCFATTRGTINAEYLRLIESALQVWQQSWEATRESTLDPSSPKGPLGFNSTALLRLVHIRLHADTGPGRRLISKNPQEIAQAFSNGEIYVRDRSPHLDRAVLQCIHAFSVPVRVGIAYVTRTQAFNWSFQHALCNLECAFLLTHWLHALATDVESSGGIQCLRPDERRLFDMLASLVQETEWGHLLDETQTHASRIRRLSAIVLRTWAETFKGFQVFDIVHMIGTVLSTVAQTLMTDHE